MLPAISVNELSYSYPVPHRAAVHERPVLKNISFTVQSGEYLAILGPNGGGKTTLLKLLLGLLAPTHGTVKLFGSAPTSMRQEIGYVPQHTRVQPSFPATALDVTLMGFANYQGKGLLGRWRHTSAQREQAMHCLENVGLESLAHTHMAKLSGGQQQRVLAARALVAGPRLILLDEPTSNIDPQGKFCFYEFLATLRPNMTIVVVSHDISIAGPVFTSVAMVNKTLCYNPQPTLTRDMLTMLYGTHDKTCPMDAFIHSVANIFPDSPENDA